MAIELRNIQDILFQANPRVNIDDTLSKRLLLKIRNEYTLEYHT